MVRTAIGRALLLSWCVLPLLANAGRAQSILASPATVNLLETGDVTFDVQLSQAPGSPVTVDMARLSGALGVQITTGASLNFSAANFADPQQVTLHAVNDTNALDARTVIRCAATGWRPADVAVNLIDDDRRLLVRPASAPVVEGGTGNFYVQLGGWPADSLLVTVAMNRGDGDISVASGAALTFTRANWNVAQMVTLAAGEDDDTLAGQAFVRCSAPGWVLTDTPAVEVDNDRRIIVQPTPVDVPENGQAGFQVRLGGDPGAPRYVQVGVLFGDPDIRLVKGGLLLGFTRSNWYVPQTVLVRAADDDDVLSGRTTLVLTTSGWPATLQPADEIDDDFGIVVTPTQLWVPEGGSATLTARLSQAPASTVTVSVRHASGDPSLTVSPPTRTFTPGNWDVPQTFTVSVAEDSDPAIALATFLCSTPGAADVEVNAAEQENDG